MHSRRPFFASFGSQSFEPILRLESHLPFAKFRFRALRVRAASISLNAGPLLEDVFTWSLHDPLKMGSVAEIMGSWTHF